MSDVNTVVLSGRLCAEPEVRYTPKGMAITEMRLASNRKRGDKDEAVFTKVTAFDKLAEIVGTHKHKGDTVIVTGRLALNSWEKDGVKHQQLYVVANEVTFGQSAKTPAGVDAPIPGENPVARTADAPAVASEDEDEIPF